ncbi:hypothetical protein D3C71_188320 [compost metagenome]
MTIDNSIWTALETPSLGGFSPDADFRLERAEVLIDEIRAPLTKVLKRVSETGLLRIVSEHVDDPGFDLAFRRILDDCLADDIISPISHGHAPSLVSQAMSDLSARGGKGANTEFFTVFAIPVTGSIEDIEDAFVGADGAAIVQDTLRQTGLMGPDTSVAFLPQVFHPMDISRITPGASRHLGMKLAGKLVLDIGDLDDIASEVTDNFHFFRGDEKYHEPNDGRTTRFMVGGYYVSNPGRKLNQDGLGAVIVGQCEFLRPYDTDTKFMDELAQRFGGSLDFGLPGSFNLTCARVAVGKIKRDLANEAFERGLVDSPDEKIKHDELFHSILDDKVIVETVYKGEELGPVAVPYSFIAGADALAAQMILLMARKVGEKPSATAPAVGLA